MKPEQQDLQGLRVKLAPPEQQDRKAKQERPETLARPVLRE